MAEEIKKEEPKKEIKLNLKYKRDPNPVTVKLYIRQVGDSYEALLEGEMEGRDKAMYEEETVQVMRSWQDLENNLHRFSTILGMRDTSLYTKLLLMYCLKGCSLLPKEEIEFEKDETGIERLSPSFADEIFGPEGLPRPIASAIIRAVQLKA